MNEFIAGVHNKANRNFKDRAFSIQRPADQNSALTPTLIRLRSYSRPLISELEFV